MDNNKNIFETHVDKNGFPEKPPMTLAKLQEELKSGYSKEETMGKIVLINGKPIDRIVFGDTINFIGGEFSEKLPINSKETKDIFDAPTDKNGFPKKPLMTFAKFLEELKINNSTEFTSKLVLMDGKNIDHIKFGEAVDFVGKE